MPLSILSKKTTAEFDIDRTRGFPAEFLGVYVLTPPEAVDAEFTAPVVALGMPCATGVIDAFCDDPRGLMRRGFAAAALRRGNHVHPGGKEC